MYQVFYRTFIVRKYSFSNYYNACDYSDQLMNFVLGMTQAVIPSLVKMNISGISVGVNAISAAPAVPKGAFLWKYNGQSVMATWHPGQQ